MVTTSSVTFADAGRLPGAGRLGVRLLRAPKRKPSERAIRHALLTELKHQVYVQSHGIYGGRGIHAELTLSHGIMSATTRSSFDAPCEPAWSQRAAEVLKAASTLP
jgi:hypothetical protein